MRLLSATITILFACLVIITAQQPDQQHHPARRFRPDRTRRQGYADGPKAQPIKDFKPEVPALYTAPVSGAFRSEDSNQEQGTTTEAFHVPTSELSKHFGDEVSESYPTEKVIFATTPSGTTLEPSSTELSRAPVPTTPGRTGDNLSRNGITNGHSTLGQGQQRKLENEKIPEQPHNPRHNEVFNGESFEKGKLSNSLLDNLSPPSSHSYTNNEIPRVYSVRPVNTDQLENAYYGTKPPAGLYRQPMEIRQEFNQFEPMQSIQYNKPTMAPKYQMYRHRIVEGQATAEVNDFSRMNFVDDMSLEGLDGHIVDANLLERVQRIIENHEREQRQYYKYQQPQRHSTGGYSPVSMSYEAQAQVQAPAPRRHFSSLQQQDPFYRMTKSFPGNPNLEFQPAILTGHFVQTSNELRPTVNDSMQMVVLDRNGREYYLPPLPGLDYHEQNAIPTSYHQQVQNFDQPSYHPRMFETTPQNYYEQSNSIQTSPLFEPSWVHRAPPGLQLSTTAEPKPETGFRPSLMTPLGPSSGHGSTIPYYQMANSLENFEPSPRPREYLPPFPRTMSPFSYGNRDDNLNLKNSSPNGNPNVITRTIVIQEEPNGNAGLSNRAVVTGADFGGKHTLEQGYTGMNLHKTPFPLTDSMMGGVRDGIQSGDFSNPNQFQFLSASAQLQVGEDRKGSSTRPPQSLYDGPSRSNPAEVKGQEEIEKPRPIYGIPIAPVLGPESLDDSVVVDAPVRSVNTLSRQYHQVEASIPSDSNLFELYRLPNNSTIGQRRRSAHYDMRSELENSKRFPQFERHWLSFSQ